jgi:hypothetical protein
VQRRRHECRDVGNELRAVGVSADDDFHADEEVERPEIDASREPVSEADRRR